MPERTRNQDYSIFAPNKLRKMKKITLIFLGITLLAAACNNEKSTTDPKDNPGDTAAQGEIKPDAATEALTGGMEKKKEELMKLTPLPAEQLKALLPETFMGAARTNDDVGSTNGANRAMAEYSINDSTIVRLEIYDCAGSAGSGIYSLQFMSLAGFQQETEEEYTKSVEIGGNTGFEHCDKTTNDCTVTFFGGDRFLVTLQGEKVGAPALKHAAAQLKLK